ncbi:MAG TPA: TonB family protein [Stenotrophomonas sp.]|nr:TonB family protein [Stenotrophomonas sp.]
MVRTQSSPFAFRFDPSRILALSTAIALHLLALLLLLIPLSHRSVPTPPQAVSPRWQMPISVPPPPVPVPITQQRPQPPTPAIPHPARPTPTTLPVATAEAATVTEPAAEPATASQPVDTGSADIAGPMVGASLQYLSAPPPPYPRAALMDRRQGTVLLQVRVDAGGLPVAVEIARSSGFRVLDQAAREQVLRRWRFRPALQDGQPVEAIGLVPVAFSLSQ